jgi:exopolyphosphatase/guanosine-5'-triphosphate,3'-diphosphate pyrophosphatase
VTKKKKAGRPALEFSPVAIVDIGSNSIRLLVYDGLRRSPVPLFNEKLICGLGRGVAVTGQLDDKAVERALRELRRFKVLCDQIGIGKIFAVATAAVREAKNGSAFVTEARVALGAKINVLSGKREAQLTALGVLAAIPSADGIVGDLGGGSLELVDISGGEIGDSVTLALGPLRLIDMSGGSMSKARKIADEMLAGSPVVQAMRDRSFYAVGGAWRNLARLHMAQNHYPLNILHHYELPKEAAQAMSLLISGLSPETLREIRIISKDRAETLPYGALVLERLLRAAEPQKVVVSAFGVREGLLFSKLPKRARDRDPLLAACGDFAKLRARSPKHARELCAWTDQLFQNGGLDETPRQKVLRHSACMLADIGWRAHPDYRGERSLTIISQGAFVGIDHAERVFLALTVFYRYEGVWSERAPSSLRNLVDEDLTLRARIVSAAQRLAYLLSGAMPGLLPRLKLSHEEKRTMTLSLPETHRDLMGERVEKRFAELAMLAGRQPTIQIGKGKEYEWYKEPKLKQVLVAP